MSDERIPATPEEWWERYGPTDGAEVMAKMWQERRVEFFGTTRERVWVGVEQRDGKIWGADFDTGASLDMSKLRALAALCLHGQPFGFTREDLACLRAAMASLEHHQIPQPCLESLYDRIEALLPPEEP